MDFHDGIMITCILKQDNKVAAFDKQNMLPWQCVCIIDNYVECQTKKQIKHVMWWSGKNMGILTTH